MKTTQTMFPAYLFLFLGSMIPTLAQQEPAPEVPVINVNSNLIHLDVTVLDEKGHPVTRGLTKEDFTIMENKKSQRITSFEVPEEHDAGRSNDADNADGKAPLSIYVLDTLNEQPADPAFYRYEFDRYLRSLPAQLPSASELFVLGNETLEMVQGYTRSRDELLDALHHLPATVPYKALFAGFGAERFVQSVDAIQQIAVQNKGIKARKNIFWLGEGSPNVSPEFLYQKGKDRLSRYTHETSNALIEERISLFVFYPGLRVLTTSDRFVPGAADTSGNPFSGMVTFGSIVHESGGLMYYNHNDIDNQLGEAERQGSQFYTLTYQPAEEANDGKFRPIQVRVKNPEYHVLTKAGYFAKGQHDSDDPHREAIHNLGEAAVANVPPAGMHMTLSKIVRHSDNGSADITLLVPASAFHWEPGDAGKSRTVTRAAAIGFARAPLPAVWKFQDISLTVATTDPKMIAKGIVPVNLTVTVPHDLRRFRILLEPSETSPIGMIEVTGEQIKAAPDAPTPTAFAPSAIPHGAS